MQTTARPRSQYFTLPEPVILVTQHRGRVVLEDSRDLFNALFVVGNNADTILSIWQDDHHVSETGVAAVNAMLATVGLQPFKRACNGRRGPESLSYSRWAWTYLGEYLGWSWERR